MIYLHINIIDNEYNISQKSKYTCIRLLSNIQVRSWSLQGLSNHRTCSDCQLITLSHLWLTTVGFPFIERNVGTASFEISKSMYNFELFFFHSDIKKGIENCKN